jgi:hypothetical protein
MIDDDYFIARFREVYSDQNTTGFDALDFVSAFGTPLDALLYSRLFLPNFEEVDGMIFLEGTIATDEDKDRLANASSQYRSRDEIEKAFNLIDVPFMLFSRGRENANERDLMFLADQIRTMWSLRLKQLYPTREFVVEVWDAAKTGSEIGVVFYQTAPP